MPTSAAQQRLALVRDRAGTRRSVLPLGDAAALAAVGFEPVCEVIGAVSVLDSRGGFYSTGRMAADPSEPRTYTTSPPNHRVGVPASLTTIRTGFAKAYERLLDEARALGADGVLGVQVETGRTAAKAGNSVTRAYDVLVHGVAVRALGEHRTSTPFTTSLTGAQVAGALRRGLVPVAYLQAAVMGVRYLDPASASRMRRRAGNGEIEALTDLLTVTRARAREDFEAAARRTGADVAVVDVVAAELNTTSREAGHHSALAVVTGTALASFDLPAMPSASLTVLPLAALTTTAKRARR